MTRREGPDAVALVGGVEAGNEPVPGASLTVTDTINGGKAPLYSDEFLTTPTANPITCDASGRYSVYVRPGTYSFTVPAGADPLETVQIGALASAPGAIPSRVLAPVRAVATSNITLSAPQTVDGVALVAGDRVLAVGQSTGSQNGPWVVQAAAFTRPADFVSGTTQPAGLIVPVAGGGTANGSTLWEMSNSAAVVVDTGSPTFVNIGFSATTPNGVKSTSPTAGVGYATGAGGAVTQITTSATAVTLNKVTGQITTVALTTAAAAEERFTVNNTTVVATDTVVVGTTYNGAGTPMVGVVNIAANAFDIVVTNLHASNALNAAMVINFAVIKGVAA